MIELYNIEKTYQLGPATVPVLRGVSIYIEKGDFVAIMGASGSGKSTLMNIVGMLDRPSQGVYRLEGQNIGLLSDDQVSVLRNRKVGFVFQAFHLLPHLSALENVALPLVYRGLKETELRRRARLTLRKVGMEQWAEHKPAELSGGQQQRVAIARALVGNPAVVLADEPTGALDTQVGWEIMNLFAQLNQDENLTLLLITHDPGVARRCKHVLELREGLLREATQPAARSEPGDQYSTPHYR